MRNYLRVSPGLLVVGNAAWVCAAGPRSFEVGTKFLLPRRDRLKSSVSLVCFARKVRCVCREERRMLCRKPRGGTEQSGQGKNCPGKKPKSK